MIYLDELNKKTLDYHKTLEDRVSELFLFPLRPLGIDYFSYNKFCGGSSYEMFLSGYGSGYIEDFLNLKLDILLHSAEFLPLKHGRFYTLWPAVRDNPVLENLYNHNKAILHLFILFFKEKSKDIKNKNSHTPLWHYQNGYEFNLPKIYEELPDQYSKFVAQTELKKYHITFNNIHSTLTLRQLEVLSQLSRGKTGKEIGKILELSPRTIETYLEAIKNKFSLYTRSDLITLWEKNPFFQSLFKK